MVHKGLAIPAAIAGFEKSKGRILVLPICDHCDRNEYFKFSPDDPIGPGGLGPESTARVFSYMKKMSGQTYYCDDHNYIGWERKPSGYNQGIPLPKRS